MDAPLFLFFFFLKILVLIFFIRQISHEYFNIIHLSKYFQAYFVTQCCKFQGWFWFLWILISYTSFPLKFMIYYKKAYPHICSRTFFLHILILYRQNSVTQAFAVICGPQFFQILYINMKTSLVWNLLLEFNISFILIGNCISNEIYIITDRAFGSICWSFNSFSKCPVSSWWSIVSIT